MIILGIDLGGSRVKLAIVDDGRVLELNVFPIRSDMPMQAALDMIAAQAAGMAGIAECRGVGFAYPGIVDMQNQRVLCINDKYTDAAETDFAGWAKERFGLELKLINDAAAALLGEMDYGAGRGFDSAALMMVGTGIGTAAYFQERLLTGKHGAMGIMGGHIAIAHDRPRPCTCGNVGCLEAYAGTWALTEGREAGDKVCRDVFQSALNALCTGAANLVNAYDPELLILGGGASRIREMRSAIQAHLDRYCWGRVRVAAADNPEASVALGLSGLFEKREKRGKNAFSEQL